MLKKIALAALEVEVLFPGGIPLLTTSSRSHITLTSKQALCLVAHMFLLTTARQAERKMNARCFFHWLVTEGLETQLRFILSYFAQADPKEERQLSIFRHGLPKPLLSFDELKCPGVMTKVEIEFKRSIEDFAGSAYLQADFANEYLGGGAAEFGNVQEEILFLTHPELFAAQLVCEVMDPCEAISIHKMKRFSLYKGYGGSLAYAGKCDESHEDSMIVAFDAVVSERGLNN